MHININQELIQKIQKGIKLNLYKGALIGTILTTTVGPAMIPTQNVSAAEITQEYNDTNTMINNMALSALATTKTATTSTKKVEASEEYLTVKQLNDKITTLQKKYKNVNKDEIKALVVGANLDNIKDDVLFKVLGVKSNKDLTKWSKKLESAIENLTLNRIRWHCYNIEVRDIAPALKYSQMPKLQELFFDSKVVKHTKFMDSLVENIAIKINDDFEKARRSKITAIAYFYDYYTLNYPDYLEGFLFDFDDPELGDSANYVINSYFCDFISGTAIMNSTIYVPESDPDGKMGKYASEYLKSYNPFEIRATIEKKGQYLTVRELNDRIKKLQKKYKNVNKDEIKALVVGANLDNIKDDVLMEVLGAKTKSDLTKWSKKLEDALKNKTKTAINWHKYKNGSIDKAPSLTYNQTVKLQDLFFNKKVIKHAKILEGLVKTISVNPYNNLKETQASKIAAIVHFYDLDYKGYTEQFLFKFNDKNLGDSANFVIDYYLCGLIGSSAIEDSNEYAPVSDPELEMYEYAVDLLSNSNPLKKKVEKVKIK